MGSGKYSKRKVISALRHFEKISGKFMLLDATRENYKIKPIFASDISYPVAANHPNIHESIVKGIAARLEKWKVCTKAEFINEIK